MKKQFKDQLEPYLYTLLIRVPQVHTVISKLQTDHA